MSDEFRDIRAWFDGFPVCKQRQAWSVGLDRGLPIVQTSSWDGPVAMDAIFTWAGWPDDPDPAKARRCFMFHRTDEPELRGSYKHPACTIRNGRPVVSSAGLAASLTRLAGTKGPSPAQKEQARNTVEYFKDKLEKNAGLRGG